MKSRLPEKIRMKFYRPPENVVSQKDDLRSYIRENYHPNVQYSIAYFVQAPPDRQPSDGNAAEDSDRAQSIAKQYYEWEKKNAVRKSFSSEVLRLLEERRTDPVAFYKRAGLDKKMFYKIKSDYLYRPSKDTAVKCCLGLRLSIREAEALIDTAGYSLTRGDGRDLAIRYCLEKGILNLKDVNYLLSEIGERLL